MRCDLHAQNPTVWSFQQQQQKKIPLLSSRFNHQNDTFNISTSSLQTSAGFVCFFFHFSIQMHCIKRSSVQTNKKKRKITNTHMHTHTLKRVHTHTHRSAINIVCIQKNEIP